MLAQQDVPGSLAGCVEHGKRVSCDSSAPSRSGSGDDHGNGSSADNSHPFKSTMQPDPSHGDIPGVQHSEQYKMMQLYRADHPDNVAGGPLPWENRDDQNWTLEIEAQGLLDRFQKPLKAGEVAYKETEDPRAVAHWLNALSKYTLTVWWEWENEDLVLDEIKQINDRAIKMLKANLRAQLSKLEPFYTDPPEVQQMKWNLVHRREHLLDLFDGRMYYLKRDTPAIISIPQTYLASQRRKPLANEQANESLQQLIGISENQGWERTECSWIAHRCY